MRPLCGFSAPISTTEIAAQVRRLSASGLLDWLLLAMSSSSPGIGETVLVRSSFLQDDLVGILIIIIDFLVKDTTRWGYSHG